MIYIWSKAKNDLLLNLSMKLYFYNFATSTLSLFTFHNAITIYV